jgi:protein HIRA/HIR1
MAGTPAFAAVALSDGSLILYTPAGRRALPPVELGAPVVMMEAAGLFELLVLTADGKLAAWQTTTVG